MMSISSAQNLLLPFEEALQARSVLVTGHTGFTGSWVCLWLSAIGCKVSGLALPPETSPALFEAAGLGADIPTIYGDIADPAVVHDAIKQHRPELILHLAAQPLVRRAYRDPVRTFMVNTQGTAHLLDAARQSKGVKGVLCVTTDKVYKNNEWVWPYREEDALGGKDPYSASKSAAEFVIQSFAASYPWQTGEGPAIATARGGNIVGGGDWSEDRLIPDFVRAVNEGGKLTLRYPEATRPWQHVLALAHGYLMLLAGLISESPGKYAQAWNLGPSDNREYSVRQVLELMASDWHRPVVDYLDNPLPEARALALDSSKARHLLGWQSPWGTERVIAETTAWYRNYYDNPAQARRYTLDQINALRAELAALQ
ncbi:CDP-glucose 4,6-dehydratase [Variovorax sp. LjRoot290]|uniref:CDP-glucose 4,6-dehydratase n=1 Tax=Variovorax sp. LjRoot290 TaxID=3342316 RepID=UPI003F515E59